MTSEQYCCSVCGKTFEPELTFQVEEHHHNDADGQRRTEFAYYCSLDCLSQSHESGGRAQCDVCNRVFSVELVSQVINHRGRRHHACSTDCRRQLLDRLNGPSLRPVAVSAPSPASPLALATDPTAAGGTGARAALRPTLSAVQRSSSASRPLEVVAETAPQQPIQQRNAKPPAAQPDPAAEDITWRRIEAALDGRTQVVAVFNHKGGTGKTTTAVTVAAGLAAKGRRVLLVDTDGQGNVGVSLGLQREKTLYHVLVMGLDPHEAIVEVRPNLDVLPSNETLAAAELFLAGRQRRDRFLATRLAGLRSEYDAIIVDCSPSLSLLNQNALVFADGVLCPVACDYLSLVGVRQVLRTIKQVNRLLSHPVRLWGVLPTLYDARARVCVEAYDTLRQHFGDRCLAPIRVASRAKEAPSQSQTLFEYAPDATAAKDYWQVVDQLLEECCGSSNRDAKQVAVGGAS